MNKITVRNRYTDVLSFFHAILIQCLDTKEMELQVHACTLFVTYTSIYLFVILCHVMGKCWNHPINTYEAAPLYGMLNRLYPCQKQVRCEVHIEINILASMIC